MLNQVSSNQDSEDNLKAMHNHTVNKDIIHNHNQIWINLRCTDKVLDNIHNNPAMVSLQFSQVMDNPQYSQDMGNSLVMDSHQMDNHQCNQDMDSHQCSRDMGSNLCPVMDSQQCSQTMDNHLCNQDICSNQCQAMDSHQFSRDTDNLQWNSQAFHQLNLIQDSNMDSNLSSDNMDIPSNIMLQYKPINQKHIA